MLLRYHRPRRRELGGVAVDDVGGRRRYPLPRWNRLGGGEGECGIAGRIGEEDGPRTQELLALVAGGVGEELDLEAIVGGAVELTLDGGLASRGLGRCYGRLVLQVVDTGIRVTR